MSQPPTIADVKDHMIRVRVDERDRERLATLAAHHELPESAVIRLLIKQAAEALAAEQETKPKK